MALHPPGFVIDRTYLLHLFRRQKWSPGRPLL